MTTIDFSSDRPATDVPADWEFTTTSDDGVRVLVSKVGGGTVGRGYIGAWHYAAFNADGEVLAVGSDMFTGTGYSHAHAAQTVITHVTFDV